MQLPAWRCPIPTSPGSPTSSTGWRSASATCAELQSGLLPEVDDAFTQQAIRAARAEAAILGVADGVEARQDGGVAAGRGRPERLEQLDLAVGADQQVRSQVPPFHHALPVNGCYPFREVCAGQSCNGVRGIGLRGFSPAR